MFEIPLMRRGVTHTAISFSWRKRFLFRPETDILPSTLWYDLSIRYTNLGLSGHSGRRLTSLMTNTPNLKLESMMTCPHCGFRKTETMPTNSCQVFYECQGCKVTLRPKTGDCCVYCSYGTVPCPPIQEKFIKG